MATIAEDICRNYGNNGRRYMPELWQLWKKIYAGNMATRAEKYAGTMATMAEDICRNKEKTITGSRSTFEFPSRVNLFGPSWTVSPGHWVNKADTQ